MKTFYLILILFMSVAFPSLRAAEATKLSAKPNGEWLRVDYSEELNGRLILRSLLLRKSLIASVSMIALESNYSDPEDPKIAKDPGKVPFKVGITTTELCATRGTSPAVSKCYWIGGFDAVGAQKAVDLLLVALGTNSVETKANKPCEATGDNVSS